jgi:hypothetical protein
MKNLGCFLAFIVVAVPVEASDLTLFGGFQHQGELTLQTGTQSLLGRSVLETFNPTNFGVFGLRYSHGNVIGGEHTIAYAPNFIDSRAKAIIYNSNLMVQAPLPKVHPYGTVGLGSVFTYGTGPADLGSKFAVNYGGGLKIFPAGSVGGRIDVRGYTIPSVQDQTLNVLEVSVGVVFSF